MAFQYSSEPSGAAVSTTILLESVICLAPDLLSPMLVDDIDAAGDHSKFSGLNSISNIMNTNTNITNHTRISTNSKKIASSNSNTDYDAGNSPRSNLNINQSPQNEVNGCIVKSSENLEKSTKSENDENKENSEMGRIENNKSNKKTEKIFKPENRISSYDQAEFNKYLRAAHNCEFVLDYEGALANYCAAFTINKNNGPQSTEIQRKIEHIAKELYFLTL